LCAAGAVAWFLVVPQKCDMPKLYALGSVDERFGVTDAEAIVALKKAEALWENTFDKNILEFDAKEGLAVNMVYDERQSLTDKKKETETTLDSLEKKNTEIVLEAKKLNQTYEKLDAQFIAESKSYENHVAEYNQTVAYWNEQYKVPPRVVKSLQDEQVALESQRADLETLRLSIYAVVAELDKLQGSSQDLNEVYKKIAGSYSDTYGSVRRFDSAVYNGNEINVYEFDNKDVLVLILAHELGHYLGLDHVDNSQSIMYYLMQDQSVEAPTLSDQDKQAFLAVCDINGDRWFSGWEKTKNYLQNLF